MLIKPSLKEPIKTVLVFLNNLYNLKMKIEPFPNTLTAFDGDSAERDCSCLALQCLTESQFPFKTSLICTWSKTVQFGCPVLSLLWGKMLNSFHSLKNRERGRGFGFTHCQATDRKHRRVCLCKSETAVQQRNTERHTLFSKKI